MSGAALDKLATDLDMNALNPPRAPRIGFRPAFCRYTARSRSRRAWRAREDLASHHGAVPQGGGATRHCRLDPQTVILQIPGEDHLR
jgi:hypothetical protein